MAAEIRELDARLTFVQAVVDGRLVVANAPDAELLAGLQSLSLPPLSEGEGLRGYEYLLRMRIDRIKAASVVELRDELATARAVHDALEATSTQSLWLADLDTFESDWAAYTEWRNAAYVSTIDESATATTSKKRVPGGAPRKRAVAKKTATATKAK
jgi:hypothetical protein